MQNIQLPDKKVILISETDFYLRSAFFCQKSKYKNKILEKLLKCVDNRALAAIVAWASTTEDHYVRRLIGQDLIARKAHHLLLLLPLLPHTKKLH